MKGCLASVILQRAKGEPKKRCGRTASNVMFRGKIARAIKFQLNFLTPYFIVFSFSKNIRFRIFCSRQTKANIQEGFACDKQLIFIVQLFTLTLLRRCMIDPNKLMAFSDDAIGREEAGNDSYRLFALGVIYWVI